jgi:hypothetical protein
MAEVEGEDVPEAQDDQPADRDASESQDIASGSKPGTEDAPEPQAEAYPGVRLEGTNVSAFKPASACPERAINTHWRIPHYLGAADRGQSGQSGQQPCTGYL